MLMKVKINYLPFWAQKGYGRVFWISSWCSCIDTLHPWGTQWLTQCQWGWCGSPVAGFPINQSVLTTNTSWLTKLGKQEIRNKPYTLTKTKSITNCLLLQRKTWSSDSPWSRSNWTLDILAWKEHTMSVSKPHDKQEQRIFGTQKLRQYLSSSLLKLSVS